MKKIAFEMLRYLFVGLTASAADAAVYWLLVYEAGISALTANPLSYLAGNLISFAGHHFVTFRSSGKPLREYLRFAVVTLAGLGVSQSVVWLLVGIIGDWDAKVAAILASGMFNYLANRYWTFRTSRRLS